MNILFLTLVDFYSLDERNIYTDLLRHFYREGHGVYVISPVERKKQIKTEYIKVDNKIGILKLKIGNIQKTNVIEKGISTVMLESAFISGIKRYYGNISFDLVLYSTPPITLQRVVNYVKKRDDAVAYLMLKDIFPQNAVDMGMLSKHGLKGLLYRYFRNKEKRLYRDSDYIGCMSEANVEYVIKHNPEIEPDKIEVCPNCIEPVNKIISEEEKKNIRKKLNIPQEKLLFVYGGNLGIPQGITFLIDCLRSVKQNEDIYFLIVGNGTEYGKLEQFMKDDEPRNVRVMRALPREEYENIILAADVGMIFLDHRFTVPNFPSRILSYMQAKLPILVCTDLSTDIGQVVEDGGFGWRCESDDVDKFVAVIEKIGIQFNSQLGIKGWNYLVSKYSSNISYSIIMEHFK